jgi:chloride channel protein, CIC family
MVVQRQSWGAADPSALTEAAKSVAPWRHVALLLSAGLFTGVGQWLLARFTPKGDTDITEAIWFRAGRMATIKTFAAATLSIIIVAMGAALGREGGPKHAGAAFGDLSSRLKKLSDEQRRLLVAIGAGAGMAAVYSVPLGGALFALEVVRGQMALRLLLPALAATTIATKVANSCVQAERCWRR